MLQVIAVPTFVEYYATKNDFLVLSCDGIYEGTTIPMAFTRQGTPAADSSITSNWKFLVIYLFYCYAFIVVALLLLFSFINLRSCLFISPIVCDLMSRTGHVDW
jgi:hypothetical protein